MMIIFLALVLLAPAFAFVPSSRKAVVKLPARLVIDSTIPGQTPPTGFFDPLGFSTSLTPIEFKKYREAELKHGRLAMLAVLGVLIAENFHPLFDGKVTGAAIYHFQQIESLYTPFWYFFLIGVGVVEAQTILRGWEPWNKDSTGVANLREDYIPGDLGFDPLGMVGKNGKEFDGTSFEFKLRRTKELNNGRLAMIAIAGIVAQELVDGRPILDHLTHFGLAYAPPGINL